ncbi:MAG: sodium-dependent transporter [Candidatus Andeanibacterium colombiense]|uniref:Transporter n=1 Tax=Candidatus Andeanibacterium colombiense TaxID=3121345 RepID=A0AAJ5X7M8_9SPHN|nr:MAG: sodium-dependent transporter [Sphingomonadaceae bacterium]
MTDTAAAAEGAHREVWSSKLSFLYSATAAAIGLGSLWRFPYVAGVNGGGAFVLVYILFVALLCIPVILAEMFIGKRGSGSTVASVNRMVREEGAWGGWRSIGWLSLLIPFFGLSYYSVIAGWCLDYARLSVFHGFAGITPEQSQAAFGDLMASPARLLALQAVFIATAVLVVSRGLKGGIERISQIKITAMFAILLFMVIYNAFNFGLAKAGGFLFAPDFSQLTAKAVLAAFGQALFSTGIGIGVLMTYSAFVPPGISLPQSSALLSLAVVIVASMAGLAIFPIVFNFGLSPDQGTNLIFVTVPIAFGQMTGGRLISILFFGLIAIGAFTSAVGMLEPVVAWLEERVRIGRTRICMLLGLAIWLVGLPSMLSFNLMADVHPLSFIPLFAKSGVFDVLDMGIALILLPLNALLIALFVGWGVRRVTVNAELGDGWLITYWRLILRYLAPAAIVALLAGL